MPCFARKKFNSATKSDMYVDTGDLEMYVFKLGKSKHKTRIFGEDYIKFLVDYNMKHGDQIRLDMDNEPPFLFMTPLDKKGFAKERIQGKHTSFLANIFMMLVLGCV